MMKDDLMDMIRAAGGYQDDSALGLDGMQRNIMPLFLIVDTSGSMNDKIDQVKLAVENIKIQLGTHNKECSASVIKVSVLCFDDEVRWEGIMQDPLLVKPRFGLGKMTKMGLAFTELEKNLSSSALIEKGEGVGYKRAVFLLLSDGRSTDDTNSAFRKLRGNGWFAKGSRIGIAIGEYADTDALVQFTGAKSNVLKISEDNLDCLAAVLENVAVVASSTNSRANDLETQMQFDRCFEESAKATSDILAEARRKYIARQTGDQKKPFKDPFIRWDEIDWKEMGNVK